MLPAEEQPREEARSEGRRNFFYAVAGGLVAASPVGFPVFFREGLPRPRKARRLPTRMT